jgi:(p)ppGpp synthase/HD superfamily hydrolase
MKEDLIPRAFSFAYQAHQNSSRKGSKIPYITHPLDVASILMRYNVSDSLIAAALLHDVVEDEGVTYEELESLFGVKIKNLVKAVSEPLDLIKSHPDKAKSWKERKEHTIHYLMNADYEIKMLSCADKLANITDMIRDLKEQGDALWDKFNAPKSDQKWYYHSMVDIFEKCTPKIDNTKLFKRFKNSVQTLFP